MTPRPADPLSYAWPHIAIRLNLELARTLFHSMSIWNREMERFTVHRLEMDAKLHQDLAQARTMFVAYDAMIRFTQTTVADYSKEAKTLRDIAETTAQENLRAASRTDLKFPPLPE